MLNLPVMQSNVPLIDKNGLPNITFQRWWQSVTKAIQEQEERQDAQLATIQQLQTEQTQIISALQAAIADIQAAQATANAAQATANNAQVAANDVANANAISASYTSPSTVLTASDSGVDATITISNFTRVYDDGVKVNITGGILTGLNYGSSYSIYYDDATRALTTPVFVETTIAADARHNAQVGRHFVGIVTTPIAGGPDGSGGSFPPGGGELE